MTWALSKPIPSTTLAEATADADLMPAGFPAAEADAHLIDPVSSNFSLLAQADATLDDDTGNAAFARPQASIGRHQIIGPMQVRVDGTLLPVEQLVGETWVQEQEDGTTTFGFGIPTRGEEFNAFSEPLGSTRDNLGVPGGFKKIQIDGVYVTPSGVELVRLVTDGVVENADTGYSDDGDVRQITGIGPHGRVDQKKADENFPPGHGLTMSQMVQKLMAKIGVSFVPQIPGDGPRYKELVTNDSAIIPLVNDLLGVKGRTLVWDRDGSLAVRGTGTDSEGHPITLGEDNVIQGSLSEQVTNEGPTSMLIFAVSQLVRSGSGTGRRTVVREIVIRGPFGRGAAQRKISDTAGTLIASGLSSAPLSFQIISRIVYTQELELDTLISERTEIYGWQYRETRKGVLASDGTVTHDVNRFVVSDSGVAVATPWQRFEKLRDEITRYVYDEELLAQKVRENFTWYANEERLGQVSFGASGEVSIDPWNTSAAIYWDGSARSGIGQVPVSFQLTEREITNYTVTADRRFVESEERIFESFFFRDGTTYIYNGNVYSSDPTEDFDVLRIETESYTATEDGEVVRIIVTVDDKGKIVSDETERSRGFLPAAIRRTDILPDPSRFPNSRPASRNETQSVEATYRSQALEAFRQIWTDSASAGFVEDLSEALVVAEREVRERSSVGVSFSTPLNYLLRPRQRLNLTLPSKLIKTLGIYPLSVRHSVRVLPNGLLTGVTDISGRYYVI